MKWSMSASLALLLWLSGLILFTVVKYSASAPMAAGVAIAYLSSCTPIWHIVDSPNVGISDNTLAGITAVSPTDIWAVGTYSTGGNGPSLTLIQHWNGYQWSVIDSPNVVTGTNSSNILISVAAISVNDIWSVGYAHSDSSMPFYQTFIEHWNGTNWSVVSSPNVSPSENTLRKVIAISTNDVWAAGAYSGQTGFQTLVEHWDGSDWSVVSSPNLSSGNNEFFGMAVDPAGQIWAVGYYYTSTVSADYTLIQRWDGMDWNVIPSPNPVGSNRNYLYGVTVVSSSDAWAVGVSDSQTLTMHWNGTQWSIVPSANYGSNYNELRDVVALSPNDIWAVGYYFDGSMSGTLIEHWDGSQWSIASSPNSSSANFLNSVTSISSSDIWTAGYYLSSSGSHSRTLIEHYADLCITPSPTYAITPTQFPSAIATATVQAGSPTPTTCALTFTDVPVDSTFYPYIRCLVCRGFISGYSDGSFRPDGAVTRGQLCKIVSNTAGFNDPIPPGQQTYEDVSPDHTFYTFVERLSARGIISGYPCGSPDEDCNPPENRPYFRPSANASRGQISKIISNAAGFSDTSTEQMFEDVPTSNTFYVWIQRLASRNIMSGYPCGNLPEEPCVQPNNRPYFRWGNDSTRGQTSKIAANSFFPNCYTPLKR